MIMNIFWKCMVKTKIRPKIHSHLDGGVKRNLKCNLWSISIFWLLYSKQLIFQNRRFFESYCFTAAFTHPLFCSRAEVSFYKTVRNWLVGVDLFGEDYLFFIGLFDVDVWMWFSLGVTAVRYGNITFPYEIIVPHSGCPGVPVEAWVGWHGDCISGYKATHKDYLNP